MTLVDIEASRTDFRRRGKFQVPVVPHPQTGKDTPYGRPSSHGKWVEDSFGLQLWGKRMVAVGVATTPSLIATIASLDPRDDANKEKLNAACEAALVAAKGNEAADVGTALHHITERVDRGELAPEDVPELFKADVAAMIEGRQAAGLTVVEGMIEVHCICDRLRLAGTFDRILTDGTTNYSSDLKTGKDPSMAQVGYSVQGAVYSRSVGFDPVRNERYDLPKVDQNIALIEHLPAGQGVYTLYAMDISDDGGWGLALLADTVKKASRRKGLLVTFDQRHKIEGGGTTAPTDADSGTATPAVSTMQPVGTVEEPTAAAALVTRTEWLIARYKHLVEVLSREDMRKAWETGVVSDDRKDPGTLGIPEVPGPLKVERGDAEWTDDDIAKVVTLFNVLERRHDVPFGAEDPRTVAERRAELERRLAAEAVTPHPRVEAEPEPVTDDGACANPDAVDRVMAVVAAMKNSDDAADRERILMVQGWQTQASNKGVSWKIGGYRRGQVPERLFAIVAAAVGCLDLIQLESTDPERRVRDALATVLDDDLAQQPTAPIGALLGLLTIDQAERLAEMADAIANNNSKDTNT